MNMRCKNKATQDISFRVKSLEYIKKNLPSIQIRPHEPFPALSIEWIMNDTVSGALFDIFQKGNVR